MCDLSQHTGSQEFTEIIHISTYDVYIKKKNGFSPPRVKMFVQPITRLGVPELVSHGVSTLLLLLLLLFGFFFFFPPLFFPYLCVSLFAGVSVSTQCSKTCSGGLIPLQKCFICHDRFVQKN